MTLYIIGTGLGNERCLTLEALDICKSADLIYFERYTSVNPASLSAYEKLIGKNIEFADRSVVEELAEATLILPAKDKEIVLLVPGDPLSATTHIALLTEAKKHSIPVKVLHNASILTAIAETGLSLYKFGRTVTLPFPREGTNIDSPYEQMALNASIGLHTLVLLDLSPDEDRFMTVKEAIQLLKESENRLEKSVFTDDAIIIAAAALGTGKQIIASGTPAQLEKQNIEAFPRCLIIPGTLSHHEEECLDVISLKE